MTVSIWDMAAVFCAGVFCGFVVGAQWIMNGWRRSHAEIRKIIEGART